MLRYYFCQLVLTFLHKMVKRDLLPVLFRRLNLWRLSFFKIIFHTRSCPDCIIGSSSTESTNAWRHLHLQLFFSLTLQNVSLYLNNMSKLLVTILTDSINLFLLRNKALIYWEILAFTIQKSNKNQNLYTTIFSVITRTNFFFFNIFQNKFLYYEMELLRSL